MKDLNYFAVFKVNYLYDIPQFIPVAKEMQERGLDFLFILPERYKRDITPVIDLTVEICKEHNFKYKVGEDKNSYTTANFLISGAKTFPETSIAYEKSVLIIHGIGTKSGYFTEEQNKYDIRFIEGEYRYNRIKELYPEYNGILSNVGFSKLDDAINMTLSERNTLINKLKLDSTKRTILYTPSFYPSSIEKMSKDFPKEFSEYNIIIKPHSCSYLKSKNKKQRKKLEHWALSKNVYVTKIGDYNLTPFLTIADIMISDESSTIFEFSALNKPVVCNRFIKLNFKDKIFKSKYAKRIDSNMEQFRNIGENIQSYNNLKQIVKQELKNPENKQRIRKEYTKQIIGQTDGKVSIRIVDIMISNSN